MTRIGLIQGKSALPFMKTSMLAAVLYGRETVKIETVDVPRLQGGDILVKVRTALTCGTDVKVYRRGYHARMIVPPALFGHELAGDVVAVGPEVTEFRSGDRVVAANSAPCERCHTCRKGNQNLCDDMIFNNGAYAEYIRIPARIVSMNTHRIPDHLGYSDAALTEPLACVIHGFEEMNLDRDDTCAVIGLGPIGLMFVKLAALRGIRVIAVGRREAQIERAASMGAGAVLISRDGSDVVNEIRRWTGGHGVDGAIEAVGVPETWQQAVCMVRKGGIVNFFGGCPNDSRVSLDTSLLHYSGITCKASFHHKPRHVKQAIELLSRGDVTAAQFVNRVEPLTNLLEVMRHLMSHNGHLKTAIVP